MSLTYSEINFNENKEKKKKKKNMTLKNAKKPHEKIKLNETSGNLGQHFLNNDDCNDEDNLSDFTPFKNNEKVCNEDNPFPPRPQIVKYPIVTNKVDMEYNPDLSPYSNQTSTNASYVEHFVPKISNAQNLPQNELMTKLNHILHLLEQQKDTRTDNITEELILYLFLGVFVIFSIDSFAKVGKYTR
jgi:hypothetical protein